MKLISISTLFILWFSLAEAHPLHLSITNITYENGKLSISMKTFLDDWETAYFHFHGEQIDFHESEKREIPWFDSYLSNHFSISYQKGDVPFSLELDTIILDEDSMQIEMNTRLTENPKSLYIYNALLTDIFPDQTNLVIFEHMERETGIKFDVRKHDEVVLLK
ncbi:MAG: hypothetical protein GY790_17590 [Bacteroidetes bacterium]|nr:hypothetical protein [Bacteroidota bacterium]